MTAASQTGSSVTREVCFWSILVAFVAVVMLVPATTHQPLLSVLLCVYVFAIFAVLGLHHWFQWVAAVTAAGLGVLYLADVVSYTALLLASVPIYAAAFLLGRRRRRMAGQRHGTE